MAAALNDAITRWTQAYADDCDLVAFDDGSELRLEDTRPGRSARVLLLGAGNAQPYRLLSKTLVADSLLRTLLAQGRTIDRYALEAWMAALQQQGLLFVDDEGHAVALAVEPFSDLSVRPIPQPTFPSAAALSGAGLSG